MNEKPRKDASPEPTDELSDQDLEKVVGGIGAPQTAARGGTTNLSGQTGSGRTGSGGPAGRQPGTLSAR